MPRIPDHEVLRCIGRGSYGEVWLARGVTGALRAVKVVRREDFELQRTFEREFEGIKSFEPVSRDHAGLVDILHVGRNDAEGFYFYVMELADDRENGPRINPVDYEPRTLGVDKVRHKKLPPEDVIEIGVALSEALAHLHDRGLSHRDIKPSNIIFVNGRAKLADIGLVAAEGQKTYVGTEGFVPPEGPGTAAADIYSLGMVLYEISTGKDRLQFPEVAEDVGSASERPVRRALNEVICHACAPQPRQRFGSARQMAETLKAIGLGRYKSPHHRRLTAVLLCTTLLGCGLFAAQQGYLPWPSVPASPPPPSAPAPAEERLGKVSLTTQPVGAEVYHAGKLLGRTPCTVDNLHPGEAAFTLKLGRHRDHPLTAQVFENQETKLHADMEFFDPPQIGKPWINSIGMKFGPRSIAHTSDFPILWEQQRAVLGYVEGEVMVKSYSDGVRYLARVSPDDATSFCEKLLSMDKLAGFLTDDYFYRVEREEPAGMDPPPDSEGDHVIFHVTVEKREYGIVFVDSTPQGAGVFDMSNHKLGETPLTLPGQTTGQVEYLVVLPGFETARVAGAVKRGGTLKLMAALDRSRMAVLGANHENSLEMKFVPVVNKPTADRPEVVNILMSIWETRVRDYDAYCIANKIETHRIDIQSTLSLDVLANHPVAKISPEHGRAFCRWLTENERALGRLPQDLEYRLPHDLEWSFAAKLEDEKQAPDRKSPGDRNSRVKGVFPWLEDRTWPPPRVPAPVGNFADVAALSWQAEARTLAREKYPDGKKYNDGFPFTSPVGSFPPNALGIYDLSGNVSEWLDEAFGGRAQELARHWVTRGGSWADYERETLNSSFRNAIGIDRQDGQHGFRVVIAKVLSDR